MQLTIECLFQDKTKAENTVKKIKDKSIDYKNLHIANVETEENASPSVSGGIYGLASHEATSVLSSDSEYIAAPFPGIILTAGYYSGMNDTTGPPAFAPFILNKKEALITLKITSEKESLPELILLINKQGGKNITILR